MTFIDLFAGIGGFRKGMEKHGHKCVLSCEIDNNARKSYSAIHYNDPGRANDYNSFPNDVTKLIEKNQLPKKYDILCAGFPCQPFSRAGRREGFKNDKNGNLFFSVMDIIDESEPKTVFLENVKGLLTSGVIEEPKNIDTNAKIKPKYIEVEKGLTFKIILEYLHKHNYDVQWELINSAHFIAHKRERVYIVATKRKEKTFNQIFPILDNKKTFRKEDITFDNILNDTNYEFVKKESFQFEFDKDYNLIDSKTSKIFTFTRTTPWKNFGLMINGKIFTAKLKHDLKFKHKLSDYLEKEVDEKYILSKEEEEKQRYAKAPKVWKSSGNKMGKMAFPDSVNKPSRTLTANSSGREMMVIPYKKDKYRKLTSKEYYLLQGFQEKDYSKVVAAGVSDGQIKKQAGNAVTVTTIEKITERL